MIISSEKKSYRPYQCMHRMNVLLQNTTLGLIRNPTLLQQQLRRRKLPVTSYYRRSIVKLKHTNRKRERTIGFLRRFRNFGYYRIS